MASSTPAPHVFTSDSLVPAVYLKNMATALALHELPNDPPGSIRHRIFVDGKTDPQTGLTRKGLVFSVYQTGRHGPQNGFRLVTVHPGYFIGTSDAKAEGEPEDEVDRLGREIPQGHMELVVLGKPRFEAEGLAEA